MWVKLLLSMNREFNKDARLLFTTPNANALLYVLLRYVLKALEDERSDARLYSVLFFFIFKQPRLPAHRFYSRFPTRDDRD